MPEALEIKCVIKNSNLVKPEILNRFNREMTPAFVGRIREWYSNKPDDYFDTPGKHPDGRARSYMRGVISGWREGDDAGALHAVFMAGSGTRYGLRLHQYGGTIRPVTRRALTIPIDPQARGVRAREFEYIVGSRLFVLRNSEPGRAILAWQDDNGEVHAAYALRLSSYVPPLRDRRGYDALPGEQELAQIAQELFVAFLMTAKK